MFSFIYYVYVIVNVFVNKVKEKYNRDTFNVTDMQGDGYMNLACFSDYSNKMRILGIKYFWYKIVSFNKLEK